MLSASDAAVSGPVATIVRPLSGSVSIFSRTISMLGCASSAFWTSAEKASRSTAIAEPAGTRAVSPARMINESQPAHLVVQQADGVLLVVVGTETVRTDHFGQSVGLVRRGLAAATAHFR